MFLLPFFSCVVPIEAIGLIVWWAYQNIAFTEWYVIKAESLAITFLEVSTKYALKKTYKLGLKQDPLKRILESKRLRTIRESFMMVGWKARWLCIIDLLMIFSEAYFSVDARAFTKRLD